MMAALDTEGRVLVANTSYCREMQRLYGVEVEVGAVGEGEGEGVGVGPGVWSAILSPPGRERIDNRRRHHRGGRERPRAHVRRHRRRPLHERVHGRVLFALDLLASVVTAAPPFSAILADCESTIATLGAVFRPLALRPCSRSA